MKKTVIKTVRSTVFTVLLLATGITAPVMTSAADTANALSRDVFPHSYNATNSFQMATAAPAFSIPKGKPPLQSTAAIITDTNGNIIYGKNIDEVRPIASITKLMTAIVVLDAKLDLNEKITIIKQDRDLVKLTGSRLEYGAILTRRELIQLAIMSSENRAAAALGRTFPGGKTQFVHTMNKKARQLGMENTRFSDPVGLMAENLSTAKDLSLLVAEAAKYPLIKQVSTATSMSVRPYKQRGELRYGNTNRLLKNKTWDIQLSKTGYINEAGRCLVMQATIEGRPLSIVLLNSFGKLTPFGDSNRLRKWLLNSGTQG